MYFNDKREKIVYVSESEENDMLSCALAGITYPNPDYRITRSPSEIYVFEYVISGKGHFEIGEKKLDVSAGQFYCIKKGADLTYYADPDDPYEKIWVNMKGNAVSRLFDYFMLDNLYIVEANVLDLFFEIHDKLNQLNSENSSEIHSDILCTLFRILMTALNKKFFPPSVDKNSLDEKIKAYIDSNIYTDISLERITEEFGYTKMHIIRVFKKRFGTTPMQYLINKKIAIAQSLLSETLMPIKDIAELLRYSNTQHFSSSFKASVGCTPNKFRQSKHI